MAAHRVIGTVVEYDTQRGFGFLRHDPDKDDVFVHNSQIQSTGGFRKLEKDMQVSFEIGEDPKDERIWAIDVRNADGTLIKDPSEEVREAKRRKMEKAEKYDNWENPFGRKKVTELDHHFERYPKGNNEHDDGSVEVLQGIGSWCGHFVGVFGEGTENRCTAFLKEKLHKAYHKAWRSSEDVQESIATAFEEVDKEFIETASHPRKNWIDGASACCCVLTSGYEKDQCVIQLLTAHVGDVHAILCTREGKAVRLTEDHTLKNFKEKRRVADALGGDGPLKVNSENGKLSSSVDRVPLLLATTRAFGARPFKTGQDHVVVQPTVRLDTLLDAPVFVAIVSQTICDHLNDQDIIDAALRGWEDVDMAAKTVVRQALTKGSSENVSCSVMDFTWRKTRREALKAALGKEKKQPNDDLDIFG